MKKLLSVFSASIVAGTICFSCGAPEKIITARCQRVDGHYVVSGKDVREVQTKLSQVLPSLVKLVPHFVAGKSQGFKVYEMREGSVVSSCGFMNNDIVISLNGRELMLPNTPWPFRASTWDFTVLRDDKKIVLHIVRKPDTGDE